MLDTNFGALSVEHDTDADVLGIMYEHPRRNHVRPSALSRSLHQDSRVLPGMEHIVAIDQEVAFGLHPETTETGVPFGNPVVIPDRSDQP